MNLNISWPENKELTYSLRAAQWMRYSIIVAVFFFSLKKKKAIMCSLISRKLYWLLSQWPFCIFPPHSLWRATSVEHHRLQDVENPLLFHFIAEITDPVPWSVLGHTVTVVHVRVEQWYSLWSTERKHRHRRYLEQLKFLLWFWLFLWLMMDIFYFKYPLLFRMQRFKWWLFTVLYSSVILDLKLYRKCLKKILWILAQLYMVRFRL